MALTDNKYKILSLSLYNDFKCIAQKCTSTCCAGWKIAVSDKDYKRFCSLDDISLQKDIKDNIEEKDGKYFFKNTSDGRCAMLDDDGLCRIQKNSDEKTLCNTCRKFPRLTSVCNDEIWMSFAASCPVTAEYLIKDDIAFIYKDTGNVSDGKKEVDDIEAVSEIMSYYKEGCRIIENVSYEDRCIIRYNKYLDIISFISEIILQDKKCRYLNGCFDYYENKCDNVVVDIEKADIALNSVYERLLSNYIIYRSFSRYLEFPKECFHERYCQVMGEIMLIKLVAISRFFTFGRVSKGSWIEIINWVYRICAHGKKTSEGIHRVFCNCVKNDNIWSILTE